MLRLSIKKTIFFSIYFLFEVSAAKANLIVYPTRLVLNKSDRVGKLTLKYSGKETKKFKIKPIYYTQTTDNSLKLVETKENSPKDFAGELIRFSPRFVTLAPGESQVVRVMAVNNPKIKIGEYRAHILFESMQDESKLKKQSNKIETALHINLGVAVPIIYRFNVDGGKAKLKELAVKENKLQFSLLKTSDGAAYSKVLILNKDKEQVYELKGLSTYLNEVQYSYLMPKLGQGKYYFQLWDQEKNVLSQEEQLEIK